MNRGRHDSEGSVSLSCAAMCLCALANHSFSLIHLDTSLVYWLGTFIVQLLGLYAVDHQTLTDKHAC